MLETSNLQIATREQAGVRIVVAEGDVDLCTAQTLRDAMEKACEARTEPGMVAVDIRGVSFIDSAGLALLVEMRKRFMDKCQFSLVIEEGSQPERVLKLGRFDTFLKVCYDMDEAVGSAMGTAEDETP